MRKEIQRMEDLAKYMKLLRREDEKFIIEEGLEEINFTEEYKIAFSMINEYVNSDDKELAKNGKRLLDEIQANAIRSCKEKNKKVDRT